MIGNSHQPRQQSYEDADEIQACVNQFQLHDIPLPQFSKVFEPLKHSSEFSFINLSIYNKLTLLKFQDFAFFTFSPSIRQGQECYLLFETGLPCIGRFPCPCF